MLILDLTKNKSKEEWHDYISGKLSFPQYYGNNLDALYDCLTDIDEDVEIVIIPGNGDFENRLLTVFEDAADENRHLMISVKTKKYFVQTFGCQMNARDSEKIKGVLEDEGYVESDSEEGADFVLYNTCTVRENANKRIYGRLGVLKGYKKEKPDMIIALCGCMMQEEGEATYIREHYPFVDLVFGTFELHNFRQLLAEAKEAGSPVISISEKMSELPENMPTVRNYSFKTGINITYGCNNFCTYCIVPYVRGREISRRPEDIVEEIKRYQDDGVTEVMLLGQNVNSYGKNLDVKTDFPSLLKEVAKIDGIERIRFMTSHPKDFSDELIDVIASEEKICRHIHLPVQSGSTKILKAMNRGYSSYDYIELVNRIYEKIPEVSLTTDIIVGFPGETEEDFEQTLSLVEECKYDSVFTFEYSKRTGTPAAKMENQVPADIVKERFDRLLETVHKTASKRCRRFEGEIQKVLVEEKNREEGLVTGRLSSNLLVHFNGSEDLIGKYVDVELIKCHGFYYTGRMIDSELK